jgi:putative addiction module component (TIGR02574 family)
MLFGVNAMKTADLMTEATSLPLEERARLVDSLLQTLNPADDSVTAAWLAVARRRLEDLEAGRVEAVSGEAVFEKVRRRLGQ